LGRQATHIAHGLSLYVSIKDLHHETLHYETLENESKKLPTTCYTLSKQENMSLYNCLHRIKVLTGYSDNASGMVNMKTLKVHFKK
jgi:hypothetical protein